VVGAGGEGGNISCGPIQAGFIGAGGGGGSFATQGDADFYAFGTEDIVLGIGGKGNGSQGEVEGGRVGPLVFTDENPNNNFWGRQVDSSGSVEIGELAAPRGGNGGGAGGDRTSAASCFAGPASYFNDERGGGGGAGGGVLIIKALGKIEVTSTGRISADGGHGGGGEPNASNKEAGGGGGGSGGMVILMSASKIEIWQHANQWKSPTFDSRFAITADGGIGASAPVRTEKYDPANSGEDNRGGFGGMGVVQLMAPPGTDADGTGNVQDDNIEMLNSVGNPYTGTPKTDWLYQGDIRPRPYVMPVPFSRFSQVRTRWVSTGATIRRQVTNTGPGARAILAPAEPGPEYLFAGIQTSGNAAGYVDTDPTTGTYSPPAITLAGNVEIAPLSGQPSATEFRGQPAYEVVLGQALLPTDGSYANYRAYLHDAADDVIGEFRIVGHTGTVVFLDRNEGALPTGVAGLSVHAKFFDVFNDGQPGLGETFAYSGGLHPATTLQLGFAFHQDPSKALASGNDPLRFPTQVGTFAYDLAGAQASLSAGYPFMKAKIRFNLNYNPDDPDNAGGSEPGQPDQDEASGDPEAASALPLLSRSDRLLVALPGAAEAERCESPASHWHS
jgi:hypothetical protein